MFSLLRPANLLVLLTYLILSAVPFVPLLLGQAVEHPFHIIGMELVGWLALSAALRG